MNSQFKKPDFLCREAGVTVGDEVIFGSWKRKGIRWIILEIKDGIATVLSREILCNKAYHSLGGNTTWETCSLRKWLNEDFYFDSFDENDRARIVDVQLKDHILYENVTDHVYLLSNDEIQRLIPDPRVREKGTWWWLRSSGCQPNRASYIHDFGNIISVGYYVDNYIGVRPVLQIVL